MRVNFSMTFLYLKNRKCYRRENLFWDFFSKIKEHVFYHFRRVNFFMRSLGKTLKVAGIDLREDCFWHGQLYVAFSRVSSPNSLVILAPEGRTTNVVYKEVLK